MEELSELRRLETRAFFGFIAEHAGSDAELDRRTFHALARYTDEEYRTLSRLFLDADARASVAFLGRDADERAAIIEELDDEGHEIVLHGYRHVECAGLPYDLAHENLARGLDAIEDAAGVRPEGFFAPFKEVSEGTLRAADELGLTWILGRSEADAPDGIDLFDSVFPHDTRLLGGDGTPEAAFAELTDRAAPGETFLFHPNLVEYHGAMDEFDAWTREVRPTAVGRAGPEDVGVVLDCLRPLAVE
ncbi:polysaccharide deacetylase family protein [Halorarum halobium]|uniref:polysaccharide deacetylase family protein n=1 Tax=Halorarum halobium TaxID=3075121 RepID=UPI0028A887C3|nr:polysaccharide deacetylase family protein [Halobaculum sp. XH14]